MGYPQPAWNIPAGDQRNVPCLTLLPLDPSAIGNIPAPAGAGILHSQPDRELQYPRGQRGYPRPIGFGNIIGRRGYPRPGPHWYHGRCGNIPGGPGISPGFPGT